MVARVRPWQLIAAACGLAGLVAGVATSATAQSGPARVASAPQPVVVSFSASSKSLPPGGGKVVLTAAVRHAATCTFTVTPKVAGFPATVSCASGKATRTLRLPGDAGAANLPYRVGLTVKGAGGAVSARPVTVVVRERPPAIIGSVAAPGTLPSGGGTVAITAQVTRAAKCVLSASPAVAGLPKTAGCAAGTKPVAVAMTVILPERTGSTAAQYTLTLTASGPNGTATVVKAETVLPAMTWSAPQLIDPLGGPVAQVSCVTATFCMGVDPLGGYALWFNGTSWSAPERLESGPVTSSGYSLDSVSCASASFCMTADMQGLAWTWNGTGWTASAASPIPVVSLSCATEGFCVAVDALDASVYDGSSWSAPVTVSSGDALASVSCASSTFCLAVSGSGYSWAYDGAGWGAPTAFDTANGDVSEVSCASATLCAAADAAGMVSVWTGSWAGPVVALGTGTSAVSCPSGGTSCVAAGLNFTSTFNGVSWSKPAGQEDGDPVALSCSSATSCLIVFLGEGGAVEELSLPNSTDVTPGNLVHGLPSAISCISTTLCMAVDSRGDYLSYVSAWQAPTGIDYPTNNPPLNSVSCAGTCEATSTKPEVFAGQFFKKWFFFSPGMPRPNTSVGCVPAQTEGTFCAVIGMDNGQVWATTGGSAAPWQSALLNPGTASPQATAGYVSCASWAFCAAVDNAGNAYTWNGTAWSAADRVMTGGNPQLGFDAISCPSAGYCVAVTWGGQVYAYDGGTWTAITTLAGAQGVRAISCTSDLFCVAGDQNGDIYTYDGVSWSAGQDIDPGIPADYGITGISCPALNQCFAVDEEGNVLTGTA